MAFKFLWIYILLLSEKWDSRVKIKNSWIELQSKNSQKGRSAKASPVNKKRN